MNDGIRRLRPFTPFASTSYRITSLPPVEESLGADPDLENEYGFKVGSQQHNFFRGSGKKKSSDVVYVLHSSSDPPSTLNDPRVAARIFGRVRNGDFEIWHLSANKANPCNDSKRGTRWCVYGVRVVDPSATKIRWLDTSTNKPVSRSNMEASVRGSPNPYVTLCLYLSMKDTSCVVARQNESSPCSQLFDAQYSHRTHPATLLIYRSLGFEKSPSLDGYSWNKDTMVDLDTSWKLLLFRFRIGVPVVYDESKQRRPRHSEEEGPPPKRLRVSACV